MHLSLSLCPNSLHYSACSREYRNTFAHVPPSLSLSLSLSPSVCVFVCLLLFLFCSACFSFSHSLPLCVSFYFSRHAWSLFRLFLSFCLCMSLYFCFSVCLLLWLTLYLSG